MGGGLGALGGGFGGFDPFAAGANPFREVFHSGPEPLSIPVRVGSICEDLARAVGRLDASRLARSRNMARFMLDLTSHDFAYPTSHIYIYLTSTSHTSSHIYIYIHIYIHIHIFCIHIYIPHLT